MDPAGLALEVYDGVGKYQTKYRTGQTIDATSELKGTDVDGPIRNAVDLGEHLSRSTTAATCMARTLMMYAIGDRQQGEDACAYQPLAQRALGTTRPLGELVLDIALQPALRTRVKGQ
jgi:hypothetical protein